MKLGEYPEMDCKLFVCCWWPPADPHLRADIIRQLLRKDFSDQHHLGDKSVFVESVLGSVTQQRGLSNWTQVKVHLMETDCERQQEANSENCRVHRDSVRRLCKLRLESSSNEAHRLHEITCVSLGPHGATTDQESSDEELFTSVPGESYMEPKLSRSTSNRLFGRFMRRFDRKYLNAEEYLRRRAIFIGNLYHARQFQRNEQGTAKYGITKFSDLTEGEWRRHYLGLNLDLPRLVPDGRFRQTADIPHDVVMPENYDWREKGAVTPVKDQGQCGSCWAFSVTGNVEGQYKINHGKLVSLSEQELIDCDKKDHGCHGGIPDQAYKFIETIGGIAEEKDYPYEAKDDVCRFRNSTKHVRVVGSVDLPKNEAAIQKCLYKNGPVSVGVNANPLQFYKGGIVNVWSVLCKASGVDHGVLLVGYGTTDEKGKTVPYWTVKNSWGSDWGEDGYFRLYRGSNECGIQDLASSCVVA